MMVTGHRSPRLLRALGGTLLLGAMWPAATATLSPPRQQGQPRQPAVSPNSNAPLIGLPSGVVVLSITDENGALLGVAPSITIHFSSNQDPILLLPSQSGDRWEYRNLPVGDEYIIRVDADGYQSEQQYVNLANVAGAQAEATFRLRRLETSSGSGGDASHFLLAPRAQKEVQQGIQDLRAHKTGSARKHLEKALQMAPANPNLNYLVGLSYLQGNQAAQAAPYLEKAISVDPGEVDALQALGTIRYEEGDNAGAIEMLTREVGAAPERWQAQWMLASALLREKRYAEAREHAERALKSGRGKARRARLVLGEAEAGLGEREAAAKTLEAFLKENSQVPEAEQVRKWVQELREAPAAAPARAALAAPQPPAAASGSATSAHAETTPATSGAGAAAPATGVGEAREAVLAAVAAPAPASPDEDWMPPDVDAVHPAIISQAACPLSVLLGKTGAGMARFLSDLQDFSATEEFQSAEVSPRGIVGPTLERRFEYLLFVQKVGQHGLGIEEMRDQQFGLPNLGGPVVESGSAALALVFHPEFQKDFQWSCEGLGLWRGVRAWVVHFQQRSDRPVSRLSGFDTPDRVYPLALKGRAWLEERTGRVLHLEADLMKPIREVRLDREHFSVDYREVKFRTHPAKLWLPEDVHTYIEYRGQGYHEYHHFSDFRLFWVGTGSPMGQAKIESSAQQARHRR